MPAASTGLPTVLWQEGASTTLRRYSERSLRSVYFPPFRAALDAGAGTIMTALNTVNGIPATANPFTLGRVLRGEWQFDGLVVSDYKAVKNLIAHGMASSEREAARLALLAGVDMEEESELFRTHGVDLVKSGAVPLARIDEAVRRVLRLKFRLGLFDHPFSDEQRERATLLSPEHLAAAREIAGQVAGASEERRWSAAASQAPPDDRGARPTCRRSRVSARSLARGRSHRRRREPAGWHQVQGRGAGRYDAGDPRPGLRGRRGGFRWHRRSRSACIPGRRGRSSPWARQRT